MPWGLGVATGEIAELQGPTGRHAVISLPVLGASGEELDRTTVTYPLDALEIVDASVISERDVSPAGMDGWVHRYEIDVNGETLQVEVWCSGTAEAMAPYNDEIKSVVRDRGRTLAIRAAKNAQPGRGAKIAIRCDSSGVSVSYDYSRPAAKLA
ncbi:MAG: hypothetical protein WD027_09160 [Gaiellales bacterium]